MTIDDARDRYVTTTEFARGLGIHLVSVERLVHQGRIPVVRPAIFGGHRKFIERTVYEHWKANYSNRPGRKQYPGQVPR
jgi:excisionase family DNA binding protein